MNRQLLLVVLCVLFASPLFAQPVSEDKKGDLKFTAVEVLDPPSTFTPPFEPGEGALKFVVEKNPYISLEQVQELIRNNQLRLISLMYRPANAVVVDGGVLVRFKDRTLATGVNSTEKDFQFNGSDLFKKQGFPVQINNNKITVVRISVTQAPKVDVTGSIQFSANVDANVEVIPSGETMGFVLATSGRIFDEAFDPGTYTVKISQEGYEPIQKTIQVETGKITRMGAIDLKPLVGKLVVTTENLARVVVYSDNGTQQELSAANGIARFNDLPPGNYSVSVTLEGYKVNQIDNVVVEVGQEITRRVALEKAFAGDAILAKKVQNLKRNSTFLGILTVAGAGASGFFVLSKNEAKTNYDNALTPEDATHWRDQTENNLLFLNASIGAASVFAVLTLTTVIRKNAAEKKLEQQLAFNVKMSPNLTPMPSLTLAFGPQTRRNRR